MSAELRPGDVVRYEPQIRWCHDGIAVAETGRDGATILRDTYWLSSPKAVTPEFFELLFNLNDYEDRPRHTWETFAAKDRQVLWRQHGHCPIFLVRKNASPDLATQIENARERLAEAEAGVRSAQSRCDWARKELTELEAQAVTS